MICDCYVDPRQKSMRLLGRFQCVKVEEIVIDRPVGSAQVWIEGQLLTKDERNALAWRDGFRELGERGAFDLMMTFWEGRLPFFGQIIHWEYEPNTKTRKRKAKRYSAKDQSGRRRTAATSGQLADKVLPVTWGR